MHLPLHLHLHLSVPVVLAPRNVPQSRRGGDHLSSTQIRAENDRTPNAEAHARHPIATIFKGNRTEARDISIRDSEVGRSQRTCLVIRLRDGTQEADQAHAGLWNSSTDDGRSAAMAAGPSRVYTRHGYGSAA